jgi:hypothetical protein
MVQLLFAVTLVLTVAAGASAQAPPSPGFSLHDERSVGAFVVRRWVSAQQPEVSPAGMCECITTVSVDGRVLLTLGAAGAVSAISVQEPSGRDISGDGLPEIVVGEWSGGAHCCYSTTIYSFEGEIAVRRLLQLEQGSCPATFEDIDSDGRLELITCQDGWEIDYCTFAEAPFAPVVFTYDTAARVFSPATPRYAGRFRDEIADLTARAEAALRDANGRDTGLDKCRVLHPVLALLYTGRMDEGITLLRRLYRHGDASEFEAAVLSRIQTSPLWVAR